MFNTPANKRLFWGAATGAGLMWSTHAQLPPHNEYIASNSTNPSSSNLASNNLTSQNGVPGASTSSIVQSVANQAFQELGNLALAGIVGGTIGWYLRKVHADQWRSGVEFEHLLTQVHIIAKGDDGRDVLLFRTIEPNLYLSDVFRNRHIVKEFTRRAQLTSHEYSEIALGDDLGRRMLKDIGNKVSSLNSTGISVDACHYVMFVTCEDPKNTLRNFTTNPRVFLVRLEDIPRFADPHYMRSLLVENPKYAYRLHALHQLAFRYHHLGNTNASVLSLRIRTDDEKPRASCVPDGEMLAEAGITSRVFPQAK